MACRHSSGCWLRWPGCHALGRGRHIIHGLHAYGVDSPEHVVQVISDAARAIIPPIDGLLAWLAGAITSAILGLFIGAIAAFAVVPVLTPLWRAVRPAR